MSASCKVLSEASLKIGSTKEKLHQDQSVALSSGHERSTEETLFPLVSITIADIDIKKKNIHLSRWQHS